MAAATSSSSTGHGWREASRVLRDGHWATLLATVGIGVLALALPIFILQIYDRVLPNQTTTTLLMLVFGLVMALAADIGLRLLRSRIASWTAVRFEHALRMEAVDSILHAPLRDFEKRSPGSYIESMNGIPSLRDFEANQRLEVRIELLFAVLYLGLIAYLGSWLVIVPLCLLLLFGGVALAMGRALHHSTADRVAADHRRHDALLRILLGIQTVKGLALNQGLLRRHDRLQETSARRVRSVMFQSAVAQTLTVSFAQLNTVALLGAGALLVLDGRMTLGALAACTLLAGRAMQPIQTAMSLWANYQGVRVARIEIGSVLALPREPDGGALRPELTGALELHHVGFRHGEATPAILHDVAIAIEPGRPVAIEAQSGAGKTTLLHLMLGLLRPTSGQITFDGIPADDIARDQMQGQIALLSRDGPIYRGTIIDNLTNFREGECVNEALYLSFLLGIDEAIRRLPNGFDHRVETGDALPAGLRQRIAIVRELVNGPRILLFDEADLNLDQDSRVRLIALLKDLGSRISLVLVSDRADVLALASQRYRLVDGRLTALPQTTRFQDAAE